MQEGDLKENADNLCQTTLRPSETNIRRREVQRSFGKNNRAFVNETMITVNLISEVTFD